MVANGILGGGVILVLVVLLWGVYLVPAWVKRREFAVAEQNALRLQRTLRVLAETAEIPGEVRVEATAREALAHERLLASAEKRRDAEHRTELTEARIEERKATMAAQEAAQREARMGRLARRRSPWMRRVRALTALTALLGVIAAIVGAGLAMAGGGATVLIGGAVLALVSVMTLIGIAPGVAGAKAVSSPASPVSARAAARAAEEDTDIPMTAPEPEASEHPEARVQTPRGSTEASRAWRPQTGRTQKSVQHPRATGTSSEELERLRQAEARSREQRRLAEARAAEQREAQRAAAPSTPAPVEPERAARDAAIARERTLSRQREERSAGSEAAERLRNMGVIGDTSAGQLDLDAAIRRRRSAG